jgi:hypothetical protein
MYRRAKVNLPYMAGGAPEHMKTKMNKDVAVYNGDGDIYRAQIVK